MTTEQFDVRHIPADSPDHKLALHRAMGLSLPREGSAEPSIADLQAKVRAGLVSIDMLFGAYRSQRLVSAALGVESPGSAALVFAPTDLWPAYKAVATAEALLALRRRACDRSLDLLEALIPAHAKGLAGALCAAGFVYLTKLLYLKRGGHDIEPTSNPATDLTWIHYAPSREGLFCEALDASCVQSLDCPELTGLRRTTAVLTGHRARSGFDPRLWWVALRKDVAVGIVLLNPLAAYAALEIVYIGVAQPSRGTGVADALLERTVREARQMNANYVTLAVDRRNEPARNMYARWGFVETGRHDAFIASSPGA